MKLSIRTKVIIPNLVLIGIILVLSFLVSDALNNSRVVNDRLSEMYHELDELYSLETANNQYYYAYLDLVSAGRLTEKTVLNELTSSIDQSIARLKAMSIVAGEERELLLLIESVRQYAVEDADQLIENSPGKNGLHMVNEFYFQYIEPISQNIIEWRRSDEATLKEYRAALNRHIWQFEVYVFMLILMVVVTFLFSIWWHNYVMIKPILAISRVVSHYAANNLDEKIDIKSNDELSSLSDDINKMAISLTTLHEELEASANIDPLTEFLNRRTLDSIFNHEIERARRDHEMIAVSVLDIDLFKNINDTYGHHAGDGALIYVSDIIKNNLRASNYCFRIGGEEFLLLSPLKTVDDSLAIMERIRLAIAKAPFVYEQHRIAITVSIGVSHFPQDGEDQDELVKRADAALYTAKESGRNQTIVYQENWSAAG